MQAHTNKKKTYLIRVVWHISSVESGVADNPDAKIAFDWLMGASDGECRNKMYRRFNPMHNDILETTTEVTQRQLVLTCDLLLRMQGVEVAASSMVVPARSLW